MRHPKWLNGDSTKDISYMINNQMLSKSDIDENVKVYL